MKRLVLPLICLLLLLSCCTVEKEITAPQQPAGTAPTEVSSTSPPSPEGETDLAEDCIIDQQDPFLEQRHEMVQLTIEKRGVTDPDVLRAMMCTPRHEFVLPEYLGRAYGDHPLPIGYGQTISQPYVVAWMTELIDLEPGDKVLEIGTGSGYQAAVLAELGGLEIYSIEIVPELAESAEERLNRLGYSNVQIRQGDGYYGWSVDSHFDAIIVTAAPDHLPAPLAAQLAEGGRLVIPIGPQGGFQTLWVWVIEDGELKAYNMGLVSFVPFTGQGVEEGQSLPPD